MVLLCHLTCEYSYQAGESIYELFDKVMVIDKGRQVFFGPPNEARAYFENLGYSKLPHQSTADYLTGCSKSNRTRSTNLSDDAAQQTRTSVNSLLACLSAAYPLPLRLLQASLRN